MADPPRIVLSRHEARRQDRARADLARPATRGEVAAGLQALHRALIPQAHEIAAVHARTALARLMTVLERADPEFAARLRQAEEELLAEQGAARGAEDAPGDAK